MYSHTHTHIYIQWRSWLHLQHYISSWSAKFRLFRSFSCVSPMQKTIRKTYKLLHSMFSTLTLTSHFLWQAIRHTGENRRKTRREILTSHFIKISQTSRRNPNTAVRRESWHFVEEVWNKARGSFRFQSVCSVVKVKHQLLLAAWCSPLSQT